MSYTVTTPAGTITVPDAVLERLVVHAAQQVDGVRVHRPKRGLDVSVSNGRARVELEVTVRYGLVLPDTGRAVQESVAAAFRRICELETEAVDASIEELDA